MYRLRRATKTLESGNDVFEMAQLALQERQAAEAKKILEEGFASGLLGKGTDAERQKRLLNLANQRAEEAPKQLAAAETEAREQKDGDTLVRIGMAYSGMGQHDKAIPLIQQGHRVAAAGQGSEGQGRSGRRGQPSPGSRLSARGPEAEGDPGLQGRARQRRLGRSGAAVDARRLTFCNARRACRPPF